MADTHKDLDYLRFFYSSEESLKDKDILKNEAFAKYSKNASLLFVMPAALQLLEISKVNVRAELGVYRYIKRVKFFALFGAFGAAYMEKYNLDKKLTFYDRFYPEPTQLQRTLVQEAQMFKQREALGIKEKTLDEKKVIDPETQKMYEQMYMLPPQRFPEAETDQNPASISSHYGKS